jgi:ABC-type branched-subunit amino acid transport system substrate-binding protein
MKQPVFGSHRTIGDELIKLAGPAAEGFEAVYPFDPSQRTQKWLDFNQRFEAAYHEKPEHFASLAYDAMQVLLQSICRAGLNRGRIRDVLTGTEQYDGVTGHMIFDPNCKNISPMYLASVHQGTISYRQITMQKPYAQVGEGGVQYSGPAVANTNTEAMRIAVFGPQADKAVTATRIGQMLNELSRSGSTLELIPVPNDSSWGKASNALVNAVYKSQVLGIIALDRDSSHLAEQIGVKAFVPVIALASDKMLTSTNIPWIFRLPEKAGLARAVQIFAEAAKSSGANRGNIRDYLASGHSIAGVRFETTGEAH